jgi:hypothetical protein
MRAFVVILCAILIGSCTTEEKSRPLKKDQIKGLILSDQVVYDTHIVSQEGLDDDWYENLSASKRQEFVSNILKGIKESKLTAYRGILGMPSNSKETAINYEELSALISDTLVINFEDTITGGTTAKFYVINNDNIYQWIDRVSFCEKWVWDEKNLKLHKEVKGLALAKKVVNEFNEVKGYERLFWVWFEEGVDLKGIEG